MSYVDDIDILKNHITIPLGEELISAFPSDRPMYQIQVHIFHFQIIE
jgi:hypothetical protein